jgi:hypothetical protein
MSFCYYRAGHVLIRIAVDDQAPLTDSRTPPTRIPRRPGLISKLSDQGLGLLGQLEESSKRLNTGDRLAESVKTTATPPKPPTPPQPVLSLRLELEEFSQLFDSPQQSTGLLVLRATLTQASPTGEQLINQRSFTLQRPAPTPDAAGGVQALSEASEAVALEVGDWVAGVSPR